MDEAYKLIDDFNALAAPTNYNGRTIPLGIHVRSAAYNGVFGMYTQDDIDNYHLTLPDN